VRISMDEELNTEVEADLESDVESQGEPAGDAQPVVSQPPATQPDDSMERTREALAAQDRDLVARTAALNAQQHQIDEYHRIRQLAATDPSAAARMLGIDTGRLLQSYVDSDVPAEVDPHIQRLTQTFQQELAQTRQQLAQLQASQTYNGIRNMLASARDQYPLTNSLAQGNDNFPAQVAQQADLYRNAGREPDYAAIFSEIEKQAADNIFSGLSKDPAIASRYRERIAALTGQAPLPTEQHVVPGQPTKGITNGLAGESGRVEHQLNDQELQRQLEADVAALFGGQK
jgi:hypothetical protein